MRSLRKLLAALAVIALSFRAAVSFLSWAQRQDSSQSDAWIDEDEDEFEGVN